MEVILLYYKEQLRVRNFAVCKNPPFSRELYSCQNLALYFSSQRSRNNNSKIPGPFSSSHFSLLPLF
jgi:hypothetical protein